MKTLWLDYSNDEPDLLTPGALGPIDITVMSGDTIYTITGLQQGNSDIDHSSWTYA